jgi:class 3 adenylate cyclase
MKNRAAWWATLLFVVLSCGCTAPVGGPKAEAGLLDLSQWSFEDEGNVSLVGEWSVCWGQLLEPGTAECPSGGWKSVHVPGLWSEEGSGSPFGGRGVATYRLRILVPDGEERLALHAGAPVTASKLWIDGVLEGGTGVVGPTPATTSTEPRRNRRSEFPAHPEVELWVQLANFEFRGGGIRRPWVIGRPDAIEEMAGRMVLREAVLFAVGVLVGLAYLIQFAVRPSERARGYFGLFTLVLGLRAIPGSISDFSALIVPWASFDLLLRLEYLGLALVLFSGSGYVLFKVPGVMPPRAIRTIQTIGLALVPITLLAPFYIVLETLVFYLVLPPLVIALVIVSYGRAWYRGVPGVASTVVASLLYLLVIGHDLLRTYQAGLGSTVELFPYFIVLWILSEANEGMQVFNRTFARVESLSEDLAESNFELQETESAVTRFVPFDLLRLLGKESIQEIEAGDHASCEVSVLYCEIHDFADLTAQMSTQDTFEAINALVTRLEPLVYHRDGFVCEYRGQAMVALFPGRPQDALDAAFAIEAAVDAFNREGGSRAPGRPAFDVGIGISTGSVLVGTIGGAQHFASSVFGEAFVEAPKVEQWTRSSGARLVISAPTRDGLDEAGPYSFRQVGEVTRRGDSSSDVEHIAVFAVERGQGTSKRTGGSGG